MLKVVVVVLVVLVVLLGLPLGLPMSAESMCPDCDLGALSMVCIALLTSIALLLPRRVVSVRVVHAGRPSIATTDPLERPPRPS